MISIKVLGPGCKKCKLLLENVKEAVTKLPGEYKVSKIEDYKEMAKYSIMSTPGLVVEEKLVSSGKVLTIDELIKLLK